MATIPQRSLFSWKNIDAASDLNRLGWVLSALPDEPLMRQLEAHRDKGRDDYPVRPVWNSLLAGVIYQHPSIASLRRELLRNGELRQFCGFDPTQGAAAVPPDSAYTHFLRNLLRFTEQIDAMFDRLVEKLREHLPQLGRRLAVDAKALESAGKPTDQPPDGRRDADADWGKKTYQGMRPDGTAWEKTMKWFGYKLHLLVDAQYELPLVFEVTTASTSDTERLLPMFKTLKEKHPGIVAAAEDCSGDRGYDSAENNRELYDDYQIKPLIDIRHLWKDGEDTRPLFPQRADNIVYDQDGAIYCLAQDPRDARETQTLPMAFVGFEKDRMTLKYRCPAAAYGLDCPERERCGKSDYGRVVRVALEKDRRLFVPVPRQSYKWDRLYKGRTAAERVNSRLDVSFGFERHFIRGRKKMQVRVGLAMIVMLAMALGSIEAEHPERMRSLVWTVKKKKAA